MRKRWKWLIALVVLALVLVGADRIAVVVATNVARGQLQSGLGLDRQPGVNIGGFPFLTQVIGGDYNDVHVTFYDLPVSTTSYQEVDADLSGVRPQNGFHSALVDHVTGSVVVSYTELAQTLEGSMAKVLDGTPVTFAYGGGNLLQMSALGQSATVSAAVDPLQTNTLALKPVQSSSNSMSGQIAASVLSSLASSSEGIPVSVKIPFQLRLVSLTPEADGVHVSFQGSNILVSNSSISAALSSSS